jgi:hypothetical protein
MRRPPGCLLVGWRSKRKGEYEGVKSDLNDLTLCEFRSLILLAN